jgi:hypothetical protein
VDEDAGDGSSAPPLGVHEVEELTEIQDVNEGLEDGLG